MSNGIFKINNTGNITDSSVTLLNAGSSFIYSKNEGLSPNTGVINLDSIPGQTKYIENSLPSGVLVGRITSGIGEVENISIGNGLILTTGVLKSNPVHIYTGGTSNSTTPGTTVAELQASSNRYLSNWNMIGSAGGNVQIIITYIDNTSTTGTNGSGQFIGANAGGMVWNGGFISLSNKKVKKVRVETYGVSSSVRTACITATEVDQ